MSEPTYRIAQALHARRAAVGLQSYGEHLKPFNKRCSLIDAIEESADMLCYLLNMAQESRLLMIDLIANSVRLREAGHTAAADGLDKIIVGMGGKGTLAKYDEILGTVAENATVAPDPSDEALRVIADGAEEDVSELTGVEGQKVFMFCGDVPYDEKCPYTIATAALAATPAEFLAAHDAAVKVAVLQEVREKIRELTKLSEGTSNIIGVRAAMDILRSEADRIGKEALNA